MILLWAWSCAPDLPPAAAPPDVDPPAVDTAPPTPQPPPGPTVTLTPFPPCADPSARERHGAFEAPSGGGDWLDQPWSPVTEELFQGGGMAVGDVDGDGRHDLLLPGPGGAGLFLQADAWTFTEVSATHLPPDTGRAGTGALLADLDGDLDLDAVIARYGAPDSVWRNDGTGRFADATAELGVLRPEAWRTTSPAAADYDRDGDLDLVIAGFGPFFAPLRPPGDPTTLWRQGDDGTFTDDTAALPPLVHEGYTFNAAFPDLNRDGWPELYLVNDFGNHYPNRLVWNDAGAWRVDEDAVGLDVRVQGMGLDWGDLDGDGGTDLVIAGWGNNRVLVERDGLWFAEQQARGVDPDAARGQVVGWSTVLADLDHDLDLDLVEGFGHIYNQDTPPAQPDEIWRNDAGLFTPVGEAWGFAHPGQTRAVLAVDLDGDGWLDLLRRDLTGPATLQRARCGEGASLVVRLRDDTVRNRHAVGARVTARVGDRTVWRDVVAGGTAVLASGPPEVHLGLAGATAVDLTVSWTDGATSDFPALPVDHLVLIHRTTP